VSTQQWFAICDWFIVVFIACNVLTGVLIWGASRHTGTANYRLFVDLMWPVALWMLVLARRSTMRLAMIYKRHLEDAHKHMKAMGQALDQQQQFIHWMLSNYDSIEVQRMAADFEPPTAKPH
jgi:hypothetical protein